jgi:hypothetical protein
MKRTAHSITIAGPTSFAPIINEAVDIIVRETARFHVLVIIADGGCDDFDATIRALTDASRLDLCPRIMSRLLCMKTLP